MELRHIRYFMAIAEERNFTRAAARLGIAQPPLSQQIKDLETELGSSLFRRVPQGAELTIAGQAFLEEARAVLAASDRAVKAAERAARGEQGRLRLGFTASAPYNSLVTRAIRDFMHTYPAVSVEPCEANTTTLLERMRDGTVDAAFLRPGLNDRFHPQTMLVDDEPLVAVLPNAHRYAALSEVALAALGADPLVIFPRVIGPTLYDIIIAACEEAGFAPRFGQEAPQIGAVVNFVAAGFGFAIVPISIRQIKVEGVTHVPLSGRKPRANLACAWRKDERSAVVLNFVRSVRRSVSG